MHRCLPHPTSRAEAKLAQYSCSQAATALEGVQLSLQTNSSSKALRHICNETHWIMGTLVPRQPEVQHHRAANEQTHRRVFTCH